MKIPRKEMTELLRCCPGALDDTIRNYFIVKNVSTSSQWLFQVTVQPLSLTAGIVRNFIVHIPSPDLLRKIRSMKFRTELGLIVKNSIIGIENSGNPSACLDIFELREESGKCSSKQFADRSTDADLLVQKSFFPAADCSVNTDTSPESLEPVAESAGG